MLSADQVTSGWLQDTLFPCKPHLKLLEGFRTLPASVCPLPFHLVPQQDSSGEIMVLWRFRGAGMGLGCVSEEPA